MKLYNFPLLFIRHQFFIQARMDLAEGRLIVQDGDSEIKICALVAQAELGDANGMPCQFESYLQLPLECSRSSDERRARIFQQHQSLKVG